MILLNLVINLNLAVFDLFVYLVREWLLSLRMFRNVLSRVFLLYTIVWKFLIIDRASRRNMNLLQEIQSIRSNWK